MKLEYALILALVAVAIIGGLSHISGNLNATFQTAASSADAEARNGGMSAKSTDKR